MVCCRMAAEVRVVGREEPFGDLQMEEIEDLQMGKMEEIGDLQMEAEEMEIEEAQMENHGGECSHVEESKLEELQMEVSRADMLEECEEEPSGEPQTEQVCLTIVQLIVPTEALFVIFLTELHATVQCHNSS